MEREALSGGGQYKRLCRRFNNTSTQGPRETVTTVNRAVGVQGRLENNQEDWWQ